MTQKFQMRIKDIFHLSDGRTAISGIVDGGESVMIQDGDAVILRDGQVVGNIQIESESLFSRSDDLQRRELRAVTTRCATNLTSQLVHDQPHILEGNMRIHQPRHLVGIDSPPDDYIPDTMTLGPRLPTGWDGDAWTSPNETAYFLRAWNKQLARYAIGKGSRCEEARRTLLEEIEQGGRKVELTIRETTSS